MPDFKAALGLPKVWASEGSGVSDKDDHFDYFEDVMESFKAGTLSRDVVEPVDLL